MSTLPLIQQFANDLGITQPVNGSWIQAIAQYYDPAEATDDWMATWANAIGVTTPVNGSWIQAICFSVNITEPVNGSWWQALVEGGVPVDNWLLALGVWNDTGEWVDTANWID
jgi:predicted small secreted protein